MTDREALLAAVRESPADDLPRLVYADWLEEHSEGDLAEWVRSPNQFCQSDSSVGMFCPVETSRLDGRFARHFCPTCMHLKLVGVPEELLGEDRYTVRHGFIDSLVCTGSHWNLHGKNLPRHQPIQKVRLTTWPEVTVIPQPESNRMSFRMGDAHLVLTNEFLDLNRLRGDALRQYVTEAILKTTWPRITFELPQDFNTFVQGMLRSSIQSISGRGR